MELVLCTKATLCLPYTMKIFIHHHSISALLTLSLYVIFCVIFAVYTESYSLIVHMHCIVCRQPMRLK